MPRNSSGTYTLPASNPVITGTTITSSWANTTMADVASEITNSLDRQGRGGMLAPFKVADGSVAAPGISFSNEPSTGWWRQSSGVVAISVLGTQVASFGASGATLIGQLSVGALAAGGNITSSVGGGQTPALRLQQSGIAGWDIKNPAGTGDLVIFDVGAGAERMRIGAAGNVSIGTITALAKFNVSDAGSAVASFRSTNGGGPWAQFETSGGIIGYIGSAAGLAGGALGDFAVRAGGALLLSAGSTERMRIDTFGNVGIGLTPAGLARLELNDSSGTKLRFTSQTNNSYRGVVFAGVAGDTSDPGGLLYNFTSGDLRAVSALTFGVDIAGAQRMLIDASGNLGVGGTPPVYGGDVRTISVGGVGINQAVYDINLAGTRAAFFTAVAGRTIIGAVGNSFLDLYTNGLERASISGAGVFTYGGQEVGFKDIPRVDQAGGSATIGMRGRMQGLTSTGAYTIPAGVFTQGSAFSICNFNAGAVSIVQGGGLTMHLAGTALTGSRTLAGNGVATIWFSSANECWISGSGVS